MTLLNLPDWRVVRVEEPTPHDYRIHAEYDPAPEACPHCGVMGEHVGFGSREQLFMDLPTHAKRTGIVIQRRRFRCKACKRTFLQRLPDMDETHTATRRLVEHIEQAGFSRTFTAIADDVGLSEMSVRRIFGAHVKRLESRFQVATPTWLGIDEIHLVHQPRCVLTNIGEHTLIEMLVNRNRETVQGFLMRMPDRRRVELVAIDMWRPYRDSAAAALPQARVVVDKFHVVKTANACLETVRKGIRAEVTPHQRKQLKHDRFVLLQRYHDLQLEHRLLLDLWKANVPLLAAAYDAKESFFGIYDAGGRAAAEAAYAEWLAKLPAELAGAFEPLTTAMHNWRPEIFAYFEQGQRITNAYTEALNGVIRNTHRLGRGYSFDVLRAKMLFREALHKHRPKYARRPAPPPPQTPRYGMGMVRSPQINDQPGEYDPGELTGTDLSTLAAALEQGTF